MGPFKPPLFYFFLSVCSVILITWHSLGMNRSLTLFPADGNTPQLFTDVVNGGISHADLTHNTNDIILDCTTRNTSWTHAFCGVDIDLPAHHAGINAADFDTLHITGEVITDQNDTLMIYLLNSETDDTGKPLVRANLRSVNISSHPTEFALSLDSFYLPSWFIMQNPDDPLKGQINMDNIYSIRFTTGDSKVERTQKIKISGITLRGKFIPSNYLYLGILLVWIGASLLYGLVGLYRLKNESRRSRKRTEELRNLNQFLQIEKDKYEHMAKIDPLTGARNRAGLREIIDQVIRQSADKPPRRVSSLVLLDIDHFKQINDTHGHNVGDNVLQELVAVINATVRRTDHLARWGGEEFALICLHSTAEEARLLAEKCRKAIASTRLSGIKITCSFGVAEYNGEQVENWFNRADTALYQAKQAGRDQVRVHDDESVTELKIA